MASTVVNAKVPWMFSSSAVGFVLNPTVLNRSAIIRCSFPLDGNTMGSHDQGCGRGAYHGLERLVDMMQEQERERHHGSLCAWGVSIEDRNGCRYNEVVLRGDVWRRMLPELIEAVYYPINGQVTHREGDRHRAKQVHESFLHEFGLLASQIPLLTYDFFKAREGRAPFWP